LNKEAMNMAFSDNLQYLRTQAGTTQEALAEELHVSRQSVSKWESGASFPEMETLLALCDLYRVSLDDLLRGDVRDSLVEDTARYDAFMTRFARQVSLAVGAILAGLAAMSILYGWDPSDRTEMAASALFLLVVTASTVVLVAAGVQNSNFRRKHPTIADFYTEEERDAFHQRFVWYVAGGVGAILFGVALVALLQAFLPAEERWEGLVNGAFLLILAGAVTVLIYSGMQEDKYKIWKYNRDNNPTPEAKKRLNLIGTTCGALMTLVTAAYVGLGLAQNAWWTAWWLFPVGGILCGVVSIVLDPYKGEK